MRQAAAAVMGMQRLCKPVGAQLARNHAKVRACVCVLVSVCVCVCVCVCPVWCESGCMAKTPVSCRCVCVCLCSCVRVMCGVERDVRPD